MSGRYVAAELAWSEGDAGWHWYARPVARDVYDRAQRQWRTITVPVAWIIYDPAAPWMWSYRVTVQGGANGSRRHMVADTLPAAQRIADTWARRRFAVAVPGDDCTVTGGLYR